MSDTSDVLYSFADEAIGSVDEREGHDSQIKSTTIINRPVCRLMRFVRIFHRTDRFVHLDCPGWLSVAYDLFELASTSWVYGQ